MTRTANEIYRDYGWGLVTDLALEIEPKRVESQARQVAQWAARQIMDRDRLISDLVGHEGAEGFSVSTNEALDKWEPLKGRE